MPLPYYHLDYPLSSYSIEVRTYHVLFIPKSITPSHLLK